MSMDAHTEARQVHGNALAGSVEPLSAVTRERTPERLTWLHHTPWAHFTGHIRLT